MLSSRAAPAQASSHSNPNSHRSAPSHGGVVPHDAGADLHQTLTHHRIHLAGHDRTAGWVAGMAISPMAHWGPELSQRTSLAILKRLVAMVLIWRSLPPARPWQTEPRNGPWPP